MLPLAEANEALERLRAGRLQGAAVLVPASFTWDPPAPSPAAVALAGASG